MSTPANQQTPDAVLEGLERRKAVNAILAPLLAPFVPDMAKLIRIGNEACTAILAALDSRAGDAGEIHNPNAYVLLEPDAEDARLCLKGAIPACPCCGGTPSTFSRFFPHSGIYQGYVNCSRCHVQVLANARDREEARRLAITAWSKRPATPAPAVDADDIDSADARLDMVRVTLTGIIDNPGRAVPLALAGLDLCNLTDAERKIMRGEMQGVQP